MTLDRHIDLGRIPFEGVLFAAFWLVFEIACINPVLRDNFGLPFMILMLWWFCSVGVVDLRVCLALKNFLAPASTSSTVPEECEIVIPLPEFLELPVDVQTFVVGFLTPSELLRMRFVSRGVCAIASHADVWEDLCHIYFPERLCRKSAELHWMDYFRSCLLTFRRVLDFGDAEEIFGPCIFSTRYLCLPLGPLPLVPGLHEFRLNQNSFHDNFHFFGLTVPRDLHPYGWHSARSDRVLFLRLRVEKDGRVSRGVVGFVYVDRYADGQPICPPRACEEVFEVDAEWWNGGRPYVCIGCEHGGGPGMTVARVTVLEGVEERRHPVEI